MSETLANTLRWSVYAGGEKETKFAVTSDTTIKPGMCIRVTAGLAYVAQFSDEHCSGVAKDMNGLDPDTAFAAGVKIEYFPRGAGAVVNVFLAVRSPIIAVRPGDKLALAAVDGMVRPQSGVYTDADKDTDTELHVVGICEEDEAGSKTATKFVRMRLSV